MARRRELKSIASGIAAYCVSRNNDIGGYWAMGIFLRLALAQGSDAISIVTSNSDSRPEIEEFRQNFLSQFQSSQHPLYRFISGFTVDFKFDPYSHSNLWGQMYRVTCTVHILDDLGKQRSASAISHCYPHNPAWEIRSARARA